MRRIGGCALLALGLAAPAWGQFDGARSEVPRVLTPARLDQPVSEVPASVTVIDRELILASGARELHELMRLVPGMSVAKTDGNLPSVGYHGTQARDQRRMLVLLDGRSMYQPGFARVNWNDIPVALEDVERIEVTRGPASAAYGANAFTGVINIITRDPRDVDGQQARLRLGNNGIRDTHLATSHQFAGGAWLLSLSDRRDDGYDAGIPPLDVGDGKYTTSVNSRSVWELSPRDTLKIDAGGSRSRLDRPYEDGLQSIATYQHRTRQRAERAFLGLEWRRQVSPRHEFKVSLYGQYNNEDSNLDLCFLDPLTGAQGPGGGLYFSRELREHFLANGGDIDQTLATAAANPAIQSRYATLLSSRGGPFCGTGYLDVREDRYDLELQDTLQLRPWARLVTGINLREDRAYSQGYLSGSSDNVSRRLFSSLALTPLPPLTVNLAGFWEEDEITGPHFSPRVGANWEVLPGHTLRASYARALRTPDIYEDQARYNLPLHNPTAPYGNRQSLLGWDPAYFFVTQNSPGTLEPERIRARELGYYGRFAVDGVGGFEVDVRYFREELWDLVSGALNLFNFKPSNEGKVTHKGTEAQLSWRPSGRHLLRFTGAHIHTNANDEPEARFAVRNSAGALWLWRFRRDWWWSTAWYLARDYNDRPFERLDAQLGWRKQLAGAEWEWRLQVQQPLNNQPVVFSENLYEDDLRYWVTVSVNF